MAQADPLACCCCCCPEVWGALITLFTCCDPVHAVAIGLGHLSG